MIKLAIGGILLVLLLIVILAFGAPNKPISTTPISDNHIGIEKKVCVLLALTIIITVFPMNWSPGWNGKVPGYRNQYELMAESLIEGKLYIDYDDIDPELLEMENPYDTQARKDKKVSYHFDHAFYNGKYYMYFGVVPAVLIFVPYQLITGEALTSYHATQILATFYIIGVFLLFRKLAALFFKELNYMIYALLASAFSLMSVWYIAEAPALYCIAIVSGICFEVWSLLFFIQAVYDTESENKSIGYATLGSLFGALVFGCRPPIALANLLVMPLLLVYIKKNKLHFRLILKLILAAMPYAVIGILLMWYNYARFDNPFEFGQTYQLTVADQSQYSSIFSTFSLTKELKGIAEFLLVANMKHSAPLHLGMLITFPILLITPIGLANKKLIKALKDKQLFGFVIALIATIAIIMLLDTLWSPYFVPRYRLDIYWIAGILSFIVIGFLYSVSENKARINKVVFPLAIVTVIVSVVLFLLPFDFNYTYILLMNN